MRSAVLCVCLWPLGLYPLALWEKAAAPWKEREELKVLFTEALFLVQHELPRSKAGVEACASITAPQNFLPLFF